MRRYKVFIFKQPDFLEDNEDGTIVNNLYDLSFYLLDENETINFEYMFQHLRSPSEYKTLMKLFINGKVINHHYISDENIPDYLKLKTSTKKSKKKQPYIFTKDNLAKLREYVELSSKEFTLEIPDNLYFILTSNVDQNFKAQLLIEHIKSNAQFNKDFINDNSNFLVYSKYRDIATFFKTADIEKGQTIILLGHYKA